jgi:hypothetical protein
MSFNYDDIKKEIKESGKLIYWYSDKGKLLVTDSSKSASRKKLLKTKYEGYLYRFSITFHTGKKYMQGGPLAVNVRYFNVEDGKIKKITGEGQNGTIWFKKEWLEAQTKWENRWLERIVSKMMKGYKFGIGLYIYPI